MKHKFSLWYDFILPILNKIVGKKYGCCDKIRNCHKCCVKNGYEESESLIYMEYGKEIARGIKQGLGGDLDDN